MTEKEKKKDSDLSLFFDTMYANSNNDTKIYKNFIGAMETEEIPSLASLVEQCQGLEVSQRIQVQNRWSQQVFEQIEPIAADNPFQPDVEVGQ